MKFGFVPCFRVFSKIGMIVTLLFVSGCSTLLGSSQSYKIYDLTFSGSARLARFSEKTLLVAVPKATATIDSLDIVFIDEAVGETSFLSGAKWADNLPKLVQIQLLAIFENSGLVGKVAVDRGNARGNYVLELSIRKFGVSKDLTGQLKAQTEFVARLIDFEDNSITDGKLFKASRPVATFVNTAMVEAMALASNSILEDVAVWVSSKVATIEARERAAAAEAAKEEENGSKGGLFSF